MSDIDYSEFCDVLEEENNDEYNDPASGYLIEGTMYKGKLVEVVLQEGGEGEGEKATLVLKIGEEYYRMDYSYYSYDGFDTDGCYLYLVTPKEKTITVYEP